MKRISSSKCIYAFSPVMKPVESVDSGEILIFETLDALGGQIRTENDTTQIDFSKVNPATGPVFVLGAKPGETLKIKVLEVEVDTKGVIVAEESLGVIPEMVNGFAAKILDVENNLVHFDGLKIPISPMIGVIGVAPEADEFPTGTAHRHGGNMDTKYIKEGSTIYLPIFQEGALLALGDVHALMADGEVCVSACEVSAKVLVKVDVVNWQIKWPILETKEGYFIIVSLPDINEAFKEATLEAVRFLSERLSIPMKSAYMLASLVVDIQISQLVDPNKTVRAFIPKTILI